MVKLRAGDKEAIQPITQVIAATMAIDDMGVKPNQKAREFVLFGGEMPEPVFINLVGDA